MEDESNLVIIKTEIKEETPEDPSTAINHFSPYKEHNYNEVMSEEYYNSIDSKDQTEKYIKSENCCLDKASDQPLRIKTKLCASNLEEFNKKKLKRIEKPGCSEIVLLRNKEQKIKKEVFDCELTDLHHSIDIKEEDDRTGCSEVEEVDSDVQEEEYSVADINAQESQCTCRIGNRVKVGRKPYKYHKKVGVLLGKSNADIFPIINKEDHLTKSGLGKRDLHLKRSWNLNEVETYICSQYPDVPLQLIGFKLGKCSRNRKITLLDAYKSSEDILNQVKRGHLLIIPNQDIEMTDELIKRQRNDKKINHKEINNFNHTAPEMVHLQKGINSPETPVDPLL